MPRLRDERSPYEGYTGLIIGRMKALHLSGQDLAARIGDLDHDDVHVHQTSWKHAA